MEQPKSELMLVTPELAQKWLNEANYERQRRLRPWQIRRLSIQMEKGRFIVGTQIHFGVLAGNWKLVNGQHTLSSIVKTGIPVLLTVLTTPVRSEDELGELYGRHDRHLGRTPHDMYSGMALAQKLEMQAVEINAFGIGLKYVLTDFRRVSVHSNIEVAASLDHLAEEMTAWAPVARRYFAAITDANTPIKRCLHRGPVVAVGLATFGSCRSDTTEKAEQFWAGAALDDALHWDDARKALLNFLAWKSSKLGDPVSYIKHVVSCWNAFYEGRSLVNPRATDAGKIGVTIRGTKYRAAPTRAQPARRQKERSPASTEMGLDTPPASPC